MCKAWSQALGTLVNKTGLHLSSGSLQVCGRTTVSKNNPKRHRLQMSWVLRWGRLRFSERLKQRLSQPGGHNGLLGEMCSC